ncbi:glutamine amidotransferase [Candidatus Tenderia electrophaga]|jgi:GMP synthase-like glutamine amidotransferase|uniref:Glutamine amidotransferase n=1 Tax=Candidatus Tenderia electrophaga TaxID=1748243 RepID=A0A0S2TAQ2_9GAMM|nr:glutamine amidotransferase [Candidatus Tenderia electrophaga]
MKPICILRHVAAEGPGYFGTFLKRHHLPFQVIHLDLGEPVPATPEDCAALVFMGGPMSVNDDIPWIGPALALIRRAVAIEMPVLGHCLGGQLISKALGGTVRPNPVKELGWFEVRQARNPAAADWLAGLPPSFTAFHWHGETFTIPEGASNILSSRHCPHQAFVMGNTLAMQCHVEMTADMVMDWARLHADEIAHAGDSIQTLEQLSQDLEQRIATLQSHADALYKRWLRPLVKL